MLPDLWGIATIFAKFLMYFGVITASGTAFFNVVFRTNPFKNTRAIIILSIIGIFASTLVYTIRAASLVGDISGMTDPEMLSILWQTPVGSSLQTRIPGLSLLLIGTLIPRYGRLISGIGGVIALWSFTQIGHATVSESDAVKFWISLLLLVHLVFIALWVGSLSPLRKLARHPDYFDMAGKLAHSFGRIASVFVPVLIVAGLIFAWNLLGSVQALLTTTYGQLLSVKIAIVGGLIFLAALNKLRFVPGMQRGDQTAARHLARSIVFEWGLILIIFAVTAALTSVVSLPE